MSSPDLPSPFSEALQRAELAEQRCELLSEQLAQVRTWWRTSLISVLIVSSIAILMLGVVAFNAVDG